MDSNQEPEHDLKVLAHLLQQRAELQRKRVAKHQQGVQVVSVQRARGGCQRVAQEGRVLFLHLGGNTTKINQRFEPYNTSKALAYLSEERLRHCAS
jgi:hypothetical protein